jgi:hypothetical protein
MRTRLRVCDNQVLWRILDITVTILGIIHRPLLYLKQLIGEGILSPSSGGKVGGPERFRNASSS